MKYIICSETISPLQTSLRYLSISKCDLVHRNVLGLDVSRFFQQLLERLDVCVFCRKQKSSIKVLYTMGQSLVHHSGDLRAIGILGH